MTIREMQNACAHALDEKYKEYVKMKKELGLKPMPKRKWFMECVWLYPEKG